MIADIITDLKNSTHTSELTRENNLISDVKTQPVLEANSFTVDVYIESDTQIIGIELKSVKPNAGEMRGEKQKILEAKSALFNEFTGKEIKYFIGFPFDPTSNTPTGYDKTRFLSSIIDGNKYFTLEEVLLANELWNFLSGDDNTMEQILNIINAIATPQFRDKYNYLNNNDNHLNNSTSYRDLLEEWFLFREISLLNNIETITEQLETNPRGRRVFNQPIFKDGDYNLRRYDFLHGLMG